MFRDQKDLARDGVVGGDLKVQERSEVDVILTEYRTCQKRLLLGHCL